MGLLPATLATIALSAAGASPVAGQVALFPVHDASGAEVADREPVVEALAAALAEVEGATRVDDVKVRDVLLELAKRNRRCTDPACFARAGQFIGADVVLVVIESEGSSTLFRVDAQTATFKKLAVDSGPKGLDEAIDHLVRGRVAVLDEPDPADATEVDRARTEGPSPDKESAPNGGSSPDEVLPEDQAAVAGELPTTAPASESTSHGQSGEAGASSTLLWAALGSYGAGGLVAASLGLAAAGGLAVRTLGRGSVPASIRTAGVVGADVLGVSALVVAVASAAVGTALLVWFLIGMEGT